MVDGGRDTYLQRSPQPITHIKNDVSPTSTEEPNTPVG